MTNDNPKVLKNFLLKKAKNGAYLFNPDNSVVHFLNETALRIFNLCNGNFSRQEIFQILQESYPNVNKNKLKKDVEDFLDFLEKQEFLGGHLNNENKELDIRWVSRFSDGAVEVKGVSKIKNVFYQFLMLLKKPGEILELTKKAYSSLWALKLFGDKNYISFGFSENEKKIYDRYANKRGKVLVIGCGAGREAIQFAKLGHEVEGIDYIPDLITLAKNWAERLNLGIKYEMQDIIEYLPAPDFFEYIVFSIFLTIPTSELRLKVLKKLYHSLKSNGLLFIYFCDLRDKNLILKNKFLGHPLKIFNPFYENGDYFYHSTFKHDFKIEELEKEIKKAGFELVKASYDVYGLAVLRKSPKKNL